MANLPISGSGSVPSEVLQHVTDKFNINSKENVSTEKTEEVQPQVKLHNLIDRINSNAKENFNHSEVDLSLVEQPGEQEGEVSHPEIDSNGLIQPGAEQIQGDSEESIEELERRLEALAQSKLQTNTEIENETKTIQEDNSQIDTTNANINEATNTQTNIDDQQAQVNQAIGNASEDIAKGQEQQKLGQLQQTVATQQKAAITEEIHEIREDAIRNNEIVEYDFDEKTGQWVECAYGKGSAFLDKDGNLILKKGSKKDQELSGLSPEERQKIISQWRFRDQNGNVRGVRRFAGFVSAENFERISDFCMKQAAEKLQQQLREEKARRELADLNKHSFSVIDHSKTENNGAPDKNSTVFNFATKQAAKEYLAYTRKLSESYTAEMRDKIKVRNKKHSEKERIAKENRQEELQKSSEKELSQTKDVSTPTIDASGKMTITKYKITPSNNQIKEVITNKMGSIPLDRSKFPSITDPDFNMRNNNLKLHKFASTQPAKNGKENGFIDSNLSITGRA